MGGYEEAMTFTLPRIAAVSLALVGTLMSAFFLWGLRNLSMDRNPMALKEGRAITAIAQGKPTDSLTPTLVSLEGILTDVRSNDTSRIHSLNLKMELELFDEDGRSTIERSEAGLKDVVIGTIRAESLDRLNTLSGKLYFKERLISRMNTFLHSPIVRDIHFASFFLQ